uniref:Ig-like domain-containing protein n=1 Tax=Monodelphis domestica TaxID=13616 RepID=F6RK43_MONDO
MGLRLPFLLVLLALLGGQPDAGVTQHPDYLVARKGQSVTLGCDPISGHLSAFWYRQIKHQGPVMLFNYYNKKLSEKGNISDRFIAEQQNDLHFKLIISSLEQADSALYLCASSKDTVPQSHLTSIHKHVWPLPQEQ